jgi:valyl-tRNA synthetase
VHPGARVKLTLRTADAAARVLLAAQTRFIEFLVKTEGMPEIEEPGGARPPGTTTAVAADVEVLVGLKGLVEPAKESERIERTLKKIEKDVQVLDKRLKNPNFVANAPAEVVEEARKQLAALERQKERLNEARALVDELGDANGDAKGNGKA